jgi:hypothetical protein
MKISRTKGVPCAGIDGIAAAVRFIGDKSWVTEYSRAMGDKTAVRIVGYPRQRGSHLGRPQLLDA